MTVSCTVTRPRDGEEFCIEDVKSSTVKEIAAAIEEECRGEIEAANGVREERDIKVGLTLKDGLPEGVELGSDPAKKMVLTGCSNDCDVA